MNVKWNLKCYLNVCKFLAILFRANPCNYIWNSVEKRKLLGEQGEIFHPHTARTSEFSEKCQTLAQAFIYGIAHGANVVFRQHPHISLMNRPQTHGCKYLSKRYQTHILAHDLTF